MAAMETLDPDEFGRRVRARRRMDGLRKRKPKRPPVESLSAAASSRRWCAVAEQAEHGRWCICAGLDRRCPVYARRADVEHRRDQIEARRRKAQEDAQEPTG